MGSSSNDLLPAQSRCRVTGVFGFGHSNRIIVILIDTDHPELFHWEPLSLGVSPPPPISLTHTHTHTHTKTPHTHTHAHTH